MACACTLSGNGLVGFWTRTPVFCLTWKKGFGSLQQFVDHEWGLKSLPDLRFFRVGACGSSSQQTDVGHRPRVPSRPWCSFPGQPCTPHTWVTFPFRATPPTLGCALWFFPAQATYAPIYFLSSLGSSKPTSPSSECFCPSVYASEVFAFGVIYRNIFYPLLGPKC